jgi:RNA polymerase sigma-70 factor (ECF subfamily)
MGEAERADLEQSIRAASTRGDYEEAVTVALKGYGRELLGFLVALHRDEADAGDTFGDLTEALWRGLPTFEWECSFRTWAYAITRNIMRIRKRNAARREKRGARVGDSALELLAQAVRTETLEFLRTEKRTRFEALRERLPEEDQMLLVLRVDRKLAWDQLARVLRETEGTAPLSKEVLGRESARLRKRFQVVKAQLRDLAKQEGLLE